MEAATLTPHEVAELSGVPKRIVEKAIEEGVLRVRVHARHGITRHARRLLPIHTVAYASVLRRLDLKLTAAHKRTLASKLAQLRPRKIRTARVELAPAVEINVGRLVGDAVDQAERYRVSRDASIVIDEEIKGGNTRYSRDTYDRLFCSRGRVEHGETIDDILADNPDLSREAVETAAIYARTHPLMGRPGGRPWVAAA